MSPRNEHLGKNPLVIRREKPNYVKLKIQVKKRRSWSGWTSQSEINNQLFLPIKNTDITDARLIADPPPYNEALNFPVLTKLRRSLTERGDLWKKTLLNRLSGDFSTVTLDSSENNAETNV